MNAVKNNEFYFNISTQNLSQKILKKLKKYQINMLLNLLAQIFLQLLILTVVITTVTATSISETHSHVLNRHDIIQDLWKNYDKSMIPPTKDGGPVEVTMDITFMQLLEVDAQRETIKTSLYATFYWYDMISVVKFYFLFFVSRSLHFLETRFLGDSISGCPDF